MRKRRVERCLLRASVALEAGVLEDARAAIDEASRLTPNDPDVEHLAAELDRAENPPPDLIEPVVIERASSVPRRAAAAAVLAASVGLAAWYWSTPARDIPPVAMAEAAAAIAEPAAAPIMPADESVRVSETSVTAPVVSGTVTPPEPLAVATNGAESGEESSMTRADPPPPAIPERQEPLVQPRPVPSSGIRTEAINTNSLPGASALSPGSSTLAARPPASAVSTASTLDPLPDLPDTSEPAPRVVAGADGIAASNTAARIPSAIAATPSSPAPAAVTNTGSDEQSVRAVLERYESAYSRLDAAAAGSVWPGVNQRALANAFDGLSAQTISLGRCDIRVNGGSARADCSGTARWTPKVGGGAQSASRQWRFDLRNAGGNWVITQATAR